MIVTSEYFKVKHKQFLLNPAYHYITPEKSKNKMQIADNFIYKISSTHTLMGIWLLIINSDNKNDL